VNGDDAQLIARVGKRDLAAMRVLYEKYAPQLYRFAVARLGDERSAEDVVQETMLAAWQSASRFRGHSTATTCLFGICRRKVAEVYRRGQGREVPGLLHARSESTPPGPGLEFWESFSRLSDEHQEILLLVFYYGFSQEEAAEVLGVPVGTVKSRIHYARHRLREALRDAGAEEGDRKRRRSERSTGT